VLVLSLLILAVMTLIGMAGMQTSILEERMARSYRDAALALQAAEAALRDAETRIRDHLSGLTGFDTSCTNGLCLRDPGDPEAGLARDWETELPAGARATLGVATGTGGLGLVGQQPGYWIEGYRVRPPGSASWTYQYRITAVGHGRRPETRVVLQSVYTP
jgi:type IV pilus assembly protein PilX